MLFIVMMLKPMLEQYWKPVSQVFLLYGMRMRCPKEPMWTAMNASVQENLIGIRVVKAFVREKHENKKFEASADDVRTVSYTHLRSFLFGKMYRRGIN